MKSGTLVVLDKTKQVLEGIRTITTQSVYVGVPSSKTERTDDSEITNAAIGYLNERGVPEMNIPARPHLVPGVSESKGDWLPYMGKALKQGFEGNPSGAEKNLNAAGLTAQNAVRAFITEGEQFEALAESTLASRLRKGFKGVKPLIVTGQYRRAIIYVIRGK